jgi:hypothetical protein
MRNLTLAFVLLCVAASSSADGVTNPIRYTWITTACPDYDCAAAAFAVAAGDRYTVIVPTGQDQYPWLVLRRVEEGSIFIPEGEPYACEVFDKMDGAITRYSALAPCHGAMMMNVSDGRAVVMAMPKCEGARRRAAEH